MSVWKDITPVSGSNLYFGFGGIGVDMLKPGYLVVAALNSWWPNAQIYRSNNSGSTWTPIWEWSSYPAMNNYYGLSVSFIQDLSYLPEPLSSFGTIGESDRLVVVLLIVCRPLMLLGLPPAFGMSPMMRTWGGWLNHSKLIHLTATIGSMELV
jgi:hypothetical protein